MVQCVPASILLYSVYLPVLYCTVCTCQYCTVQCVPANIVLYSVYMPGADTTGDQISGNRNKRKSQGNLYGVEGKYCSIDLSKDTAVSILG